jgi:hypothetical protein
MRTTLIIDDLIHREAKAEAARCGVTLTKFVEEALREKIASSRGDHTGRPEVKAEIEERNQLMEALHERTSRFRVGPHPTREESNAR